MTQSLQYSNYGGGVSGTTYLLTSSPVKNTFQLEQESHDGHFDGPGRPPPTLAGDKYWAEEERDSLPRLPPIRPNRRRGQDVELGGMDLMTEDNLSKHNVRPSNVNHMVHNFTSPIDLAYASAQQHHPKLTLNRH
ncbi:hypothetical protein DXG03_003403 [Asterophora parasitica]|uniref:Uncharacterized protein n=1 Tax=Asterophora parasitica TaxID=117018 RepID=A0A9P7KBV1_9AGAR|nr:hypothetical protein DXG03_003403 [Asterophora parasitica]